MYNYQKIIDFLRHRSSVRTRKTRKKHVKITDLYGVRGVPGENAKTRKRENAKTRKVKSAGSVCAVRPPGLSGMPSPKVPGAQDFPGEVSVAVCGTGTFRMRGVRWITIGGGEFQHPIAPSSSQGQRHAPQMAVGCNSHILQFYLLFFIETITSHH